MFLKSGWLPFNLNPSSAPSFSSTLVHGPLEMSLPLDVSSTIELKETKSFINR